MPLGIEDPQRLVERPARERKEHRAAHRLHRHLGVEHGELVVDRAEDVRRRLAGEDGERLLKALHRTRELHLRAGLRPRMLHLGTAQRGGGEELGFLGLLEHPRGLVDGDDRVAEPT
ncbi:MAG: hypothetical protein MUF21_04740, partial [Gemmatimonadaceae bacterium]|nr:hypothetical protein [Gemmatimonadaceae bacterium]MCU0625783.1 hypothetical protein [Gemmatimonadaceae bacterium]